MAPGISFDWVIVDEAAKALDTEVLAALVEGRKFILVGDQRQLPPHLDRKVERALEKAGFDPSELTEGQVRQGSRHKLQDGLASTMLSTPKEVRRAVTVVSPACPTSSSGSRFQWQRRGFANPSAWRS